MIKATAASRRLRVSSIVVLLLVTVLVTGVLTIQAITTARYHRTTAEKVLRDYARLAAGQYAVRASQDLYYNVVSPSLQRLGRLPAGPLSRERTDTARGATVFQLGDDSTVEVIGPDSITAWRTWIRDTVLIHARTLETSAPFGGIVREREGQAWFLAFSPAVNRIPIRGFMVPLSTLEPALRGAAERGPLLPPSLTDGVKLDSLVSVRVTSPAGRTLYQSGDFPSTFFAWDSTGDYVGRLPVFASLRPEIARTLIIGGLPGSRLPLLLGLLALTVALIVAALLLLRREQELGRLRAEFVTGVSHELRTPLAQIRMFAETLRLGRIRNEEERQRSLRIVDQEAKRLTHLVENLLYFSRSERQPQTISLEPVVLGPLVREVVLGFSPLAEARDMSIEVNTGLDRAAWVDPGLVQQILLNLLDNAAKYGPPGQVISVTLGPRHDRACIAVEDQGPGIPMADRERIWDRFWRLERDREGSVAGTGIGLAIVRELAELHGGSAAVEGDGANGSRFVAVLGKLAEPELRP